MLIPVHSSWVTSNSPTQTVKGYTDHNWLKWVFTLPLLATTTIMLGFYFTLDSTYRPSVIQSECSIWTIV